MGALRTVGGNLGVCTAHGRTFLCVAPARMSRSVRYVVATLKQGERAQEVHSACGLPGDARSWCLRSVQALETLTIYGACMLYASLRHLQLQPSNMLLYPLQGCCSNLHACMLACSCRICVPRPGSDQLEYFKQKRDVTWLAYNKNNVGGSCRGEGGCVGCGEGKGQGPSTIHACGSMHSGLHEPRRLVLGVPGMRD